MKAPSRSDLLGRSLALEHVKAAVEAATCNLGFTADAIEKCPEKDAGVTAIQWAQALRLVIHALDHADEFASEYLKPGVTGVGGGA